MRLSDRDLWARTHPEPQAGADWCRIEAKQSEGDKTVTVIHIYDEIGYWGTRAVDFVRKITAIDSDIIKLHINSPGGSVFDGVAIYSSLKQHPAEVHVVVDSLAASAASFIAQAGDTISMQRNATMMIHDASAAVYGNEKEVRDTADILGKISNNIADIYAQSAGGTVEEWRAVMREEAWYNAQEAVDAGLATEVLPTEDKKAENAKNQWDFSIYNHKGREDAPAPKTVRELAINRLTKETSVSGATGTIKNNTPGEGTPAEETPAEPQTPAAPETPAAPAEPQTPEAPETPATPAEPQTPAAPPAEARVTMSATGQPIFMINGVPTTELSKVQAHIAGLEAFRKDSVEAGKKAFVQSLSDDGKILAAQIPALEAMALKMDNEMYDTWKSSFDSVPKAALFSQHGQPNGTGATALKAAEDEKQILTETVESLRRSGLTQASLENTPSWKRLQELNNAATPSS